MGIHSSRTSSASSTRSRRRSSSASSTLYGDAGYGLQTDRQAPHQRRCTGAQALSNERMAWRRVSGWATSTAQLRSQAGDLSWRRHLEQDAQAERLGQVGSHRPAGVGVDSHQGAEHLRIIDEAAMEARRDRGGRTREGQGHTIRGWSVSQAAHRRTRRSKSPSGLGDVRDLRRWARRGDRRQQTRADSGIHLPSAANEWRCCSNASQGLRGGDERSGPQAIEDHALTPEAIEQRDPALGDVMTSTIPQAALDREPKDVAKRIDRHNGRHREGRRDGLAGGRSSRDLEARQRAIQAEAASLHPIPRLAPSVICGPTGEWRTTASSVNDADPHGPPASAPRADYVHANGPMVTGYDFTGSDTVRQAVHRHRRAEHPTWMPAEATGQPPQAWSTSDQRTRLMGITGGLLENAAWGENRVRVGAPGGT